VTQARAPEIELRDMLPGDLHEMVDVWVATWQATVPAIDFDARRTWFVDRMRAHHDAGARIIVATAGDAIAGFVVIDPETGYLDQIVAATGFQSRGVASALIEAAKSASPHGIDLHVNQDNLRAIRFYEKHGFAIAGIDVNERSGAPVFHMNWLTRGSA
jgi:putative acetyltransferase